MGGGAVCSIKWVDRRYISGCSSARKISKKKHTHTQGWHRGPLQGQDQNIQENCFKMTSLVTGDFKRGAGGRQITSSSQNILQAEGKKICNT